MKRNYYPGKPPEEQPAPMVWAGKKPTVDELKQVLADHVYWVNYGKQGLPPHDLSWADLTDMPFGDLFGKSGFQGVHFYSAPMECICLDGANCSGANFTEFNLATACLNETVLSVAKLAKTRFEYAQLNRATLEKANLQGAHLEHAQLVEADLFDACLNNANLEWANLEGADLRAARLRSARLYRANITNANLDSAILTRANMAEAIFTNSRLVEAKLKRATLKGAKFRNADLRDADFSNANLSCADFRGADIRGVNFKDADVTGVLYNRKTKFLGSRVDNSFGSAKFRDFARHQAFIEEMLLDAEGIRRYANGEQEVGSNISINKNQQMDEPDQGIFSRARRSVKEYYEEIRQTKSKNIFYWLWLILADCGRHAWPLAMWFVFAILFFAVAYALLGPGPLGLDSATACPFWSAYAAIVGVGDSFGFWSALKFSAFTILSMGFDGARAPTGLGAAIVFAEVLCGYVLLGALISVFATKLTRRG